MRISDWSSDVCSSDLDEARGLCAPNYLLKVIPHVDGSKRVCELVRFHLEDVTFKGAWTGPAALQLCPQALAPVADLPVLEVLSAKHRVATGRAKGQGWGVRVGECMGGGVEIKK